MVTRCPLRVDMRPSRRIVLRMSAAVAIVPAVAHADAIIPYIVVPWGQALLLPIVVIIEGLILVVLLGGRVTATMLQSLVANVASTLVGGIIYLGTMAFAGEPMYMWVFRAGPFGKGRAIRTTLLSFAFAAVLFAISWTVESWVIARMRQTTIRAVARPCALANAATYVLLLALALWVGSWQWRY